MTTSVANAVATLRGLTAKFDTSYQSATPIYPKFSTVIPSKGVNEQYGFLGAVPGIREWLGDRIFKSLGAAQFTIANKEWESSLAILKNDIDDDRLGMYGPVLQNMAVEAAFHPDELLFDLIQAGGATACFDGQYFFDTDHSWGSSGTQSNALTATVASTSAPTEAEFRTAYHAARAAMLGFKRDNGKLFHRPTVEPLTDLVLLIPSAMEEVAHKALMKTLVSAGETNIILDRPQIITVPYFTSGIKFWLVRTGQPLQPFVFQARRPLARQMKGMDDREFKDVKFMTDARYNMGYLAWWNAVQTTLST